jgi:hypothetical protein
MTDNRDLTDEKDDENLKTEILEDESCKTNYFRKFQK